MNKVITRIKGGLGNQLFCYAAARRLALANNAELVIDDVTGFVRDFLYRSKYLLDHFNISARKATPAERLEPFERYRRGFLKLVSRKRSFKKRKYIEEETMEFDARLLSLKIKGTIYLDGLWQSEQYFKDVESIIRNDLRMRPPSNVINNRLSREMRNTASVAIHVRWFDKPGSGDHHNLSPVYYQHAINEIGKRVEDPRYFIFSDDPGAALKKLNLSEDRTTVISHNRSKENAWIDLWLMSQCRHFITANSTFSWWGAWLGEKQDKIIITPDVKVTGITAWGFRGLIPDAWLKI